MGMIGADAVDMEPLETGNLGPLASLVLTDLPGCDDTTVRLKLGAALREFCRETNACTVQVPMRTGPHGIVAVPDPPDGMAVVSILGVMDPCGDLARFEVCDGQSQFIRTEGLGEGEAVVVKASVAPKAGGEACPAWFLERHAEAIAAGAMHKLLSMGNRPWSDPQRAAQYGAEYADAIAEASYRNLGSPLGGGAESAIPCGGLFM